MSPVSPIFHILSTVVCGFFFQNKSKLSFHYKISLVLELLYDFNILWVIWIKDYLVQYSDDIWKSDYCKLDLFLTAFEVFGYCHFLFSYFTVKKNFIVAVSTKMVQIEGTYKCVKKQDFADFYVHLGKLEMYMVNIHLSINVKQHWIMSRGIK